MKLAEDNQERLSALEKIANGIIWWIGSIPSLIFHTIFFVVCFLLPLFKIVELDQMLLVLTTVVSLEAIYLAIFIQMSVNKSSEHIEDLREDVEIIQEDIEEIQEDIEEIQEDVEEINDEEDDDHNERAKNVMLKSNVSNNKNEIKLLKDQIAELQAVIDNMRENGENL